jgi:uncharacterized protein YegP (UPF0339 family)
MAYRPFPSYWMFRDRNGNWRWNYAAANGRVIAASKAAYYHQEGCLRAIRTIQGSTGVPIWGPEVDVNSAASDPGAAPPAEAVTRELEPA